MAELDLTADNNDTLFVEHQETTDLFSQPSFEQNVPYKQERAAELATATDYINGSDNADDTELELRTTGSSVSLEAASDTVRREKINSDIEAAYKAAEDGNPELLANTLTKASKPKVVSDSEIVAAAAERYVRDSGNTVSQEVVDSALGLLEGASGWIEYQKYINSRLKAAEGTVFDDVEFTDVAGDLLEVMTPYLSPEEERRMRAGLVDGDSGALRGFLQRSSVADGVAKRLASLPSQEAIQELESIIDIATRGETAFGTNTLFNSDVLFDIKNKLAEGGASADEFGRSNVLSELIGAFDFLEVGSLHGLVKSLLNTAGGVPQTTKKIKTLKVSPVARAVQEFGAGARGNGGSLLDSVGFMSPKAQRQLLEEGDLARIATRMGNTPEDVAARMMPTAENAQDAVGINGSFLDVPNKTVSVLLTPEEQFNVPLKLASRFAKQAGNTMTPHHHLTETIANDLDDSLGNFRVRFGADEDEGFLYEEAVTAQQTGLIGVDSKLVKRDALTGEFRGAEPGDVGVFIESDIVHRVNPARDAAGLNVGGKQVGGQFRRQVLPPSRYLDKDLWMRASAVADFNTAQQGRIIRMANSVAKLKPAQSEALSELIRMGDADSTVYTRSSAGAALNRPLDSSTWKAYQDYQDLQNEFFALTNKRYRENLESGGYKQFSGLGEGTHFVRPFTEKPVVKTVRESASQESLEALRREEGVVWGQAWDARTQSPVTLTGDVVDTLYEVGGTVGRIRGGHTDDAGNIYDFVITASRENYSPLGLDVLNQRTGYYPRFYGDTGFIVLSKESRVINGVEMTINRPVGIVGNRGDAQRLSDSLEGDTHIALSRENKGLLDLYAGSGEFGFTPINSRRRGEQLVGADGNPANTLNPIAALQRQIHGVQRKLNVDSIGLFEKRWMNTYSKHLPEDQRHLFPENFDQRTLRFSEEVEASGQGQKMRESAKSWHEYVQLLRGADDDPSAQWLNKKLWDIGNRLTELENTAARRTGEKLIQFTDTHTKRWLKEITSTAIITSRLLYQAVANPTFAASALIARDPVSAIPSLVSSMPLSMGLLARKSGNWDVLKPSVARGLGVDEAEAEKWLKAFEDSGMFDARLSDDFIKQAQENYATTANNTHQALLSYYGGKLNPFRYLRSGLSNSIIVGNMFAYNHALKEFKRLNPERNPYGKLAQAEVVSNARLLTQTQNSVDQFAWQRSSHPASFAMQFMQFVLKAWYDMIIDPTVRLVADKNLGNPGKWAESRGQAATTLGMVSLIFGQTGLLGENGGAATSDWVRSTTEQMLGTQLPDEVWTVVRGGFMDLSMNKLFAQDGSNISFSARIGPGAIADGLIWTLRDPGSVDLLGASGSQLAWFGNAAKATKDAIFDPNFDMTEEANQLALVEMYTSVFAGARDLWAAYAATNAGHALTKNGQRTTELNPSETLWRAASFRTTEELDSLREAARARDRQDKVNEMTTRWTKEYHRQMENLPEDVSPGELLTKRRQFLQIASRSVEEHIADEFLSSLINKVEPSFDAMDRRVQLALKMNTVEGSISELELLKSKYKDKPEFVRGIDDLIWALSLNLKEEDK